MRRYDPWTDVAARFPHVRVICHRDIPGDIVGAIKGDRLWIDRTLGQAARRSTLAHEIVHLDRGHPVGDARSRRREERHVDAVAARRLIALDDLIDAGRWSPDATEDVLAELLWVDVPMVRARLASLTDYERRVLRDALGCR